MTIVQIFIAIIGTVIAILQVINERRAIQEQKKEKERFLSKEKWCKDLDTGKISRKMERLGTHVKTCHESLVEQFEKDKQDPTVGTYLNQAIYAMKEYCDVLIKECYNEMYKKYEILV